MNFDMLGNILFVISILIMLMIPFAAIMVKKLEAKNKMKMYRDIKASLIISVSILIIVAKIKGFL